MTFGQRLREWRGSKTQDEVAKVVDVRRPSVSAWEADTNLPRSSQLAGLAKALGRELEEVEMAWAAARIAEDPILNRYMNMRLSGRDKPPSKQERSLAAELSKLAMFDGHVPLDRSLQALGEALMKAYGAAATDPDWGGRRTELTLTQYLDRAFSLLGKLEPDAVLSVVIAWSETANAAWMGSRPKSAIVDPFRQWKP